MRRTKAHDQFHVSPGRPARDRIAGSMWALRSPRSLWEIVQSVPARRRRARPMMNSSGRRAKSLDVKAGWVTRRWLPKEGTPEQASGYVRWRGTGARVMGRAFRLVAPFRPLRLPATWFAHSRSPRPASRRAAGRSCAQYGRRKALVTAPLLRSATPAPAGSDRQEMAETLETDAAAAAALLRLPKKTARIPAGR